MATMGPCRGKLPAEPSKLASPNAKTPPSALASTYPLPSAVAAPEKTGELRGCGMGGSVKPTLPKPIMPPSSYVCAVSAAPAAVEPGVPTARPATSAPGTSTAATARVTSDATSEARRGCRGLDTVEAHGASAFAHDTDSARWAWGRCTRSGYEFVTKCPLNAGVSPPRPLRRPAGRGGDPFGRSGRTHGRMDP